MKKIILLLIPLVTFYACSKNDDDDDTETPDYETLNYFYTESTLLRIDVAYEDGAEPFTNTGFSNGANFEFTQNNLTQLFAGRNKPISVAIDKNLSEMETFPAQNKQSFNKSELLNIAKQYRTTSSTATQNAMIVIFVNGYYDYVNGQVPNQVIGISLGDNAIAMFKAAINDIPLSTERKHVEQVILTHEIGHAIGLVDNGVTMITNHLSSTGKHCSNTSCVMYATQGGTMSGSVNEFVFGQNCVNDVTAFLN